MQDRTRRFDEDIEIGTDRIEQIDFAERYVDVVKVGQGGFGTVFRAWDTVMAREVAIKVFRTSHAAVEEARIAANLRHPNIVTVFDCVPGRSGPLLFMEYVKGISLASRLQQGPLAPEESVAIAVQVAKALAYAHSRGVVHCDVKPENVLLSDDGSVRVGDFGIARAIIGNIPRRGAGTPGYAAPETLLGDAYPQSDIYGLAAVLWAMLTGKCPPGKGSPNLHHPSIPAPIRGLLEKALALDWRHRHPTALYFLHDLESLNWLEFVPQPSVTGRALITGKWHSAALMAFLTFLWLYVGWGEYRFALSDGWILTWSALVAAMTLRGVRIGWMAWLGIAWYALVNELPTAAVIIALCLVPAGWMLLKVDPAVAALAETAVPLAALGFTFVPGWMAAWVWGWRRGSVTTVLGLVSVTVVRTAVTLGKRADSGFEAVHSVALPWGLRTGARILDARWDQALAEGVPAVLRAVFAWPHLALLVLLAGGAFVLDRMGKRHHLMAVVTTAVITGVGVASLHVAFVETGAVLRSALVVLMAAVVLTRMRGKSDVGRDRTGETLAASAPTSPHSEGYR